MSYRLPSIADFKRQFVGDFPYAVPLSAAGGGRGAEAVATLSGDGVASIAVTAGGSNYSSTAKIKVLIFGGGGVGAEASVVLTGNVVTAVTVTNPGFGYMTAPVVMITSGVGDDTDLEKLRDADIINAFVAALSFNMTQALFSSQAAFTYAYNLLTAHYLCRNLTARGTGLGGKMSWLTASKTVGDVTESYEIPDRVLKSPILSKLSTTTYGAQFLELISPRLIGNIHAYHRNTLP